MRKTIVIIVICALACGLTACGLGRGETFEPQFDGTPVPVRRLGVVSGQVSFQEFLDLLQQMQSRGDYRPLAQSRTVNRQQSYMNHWRRFVYYAYPRFTDEISGPAAQEIDAYYRQRYRACTARQDFTWLTDHSEITDNVDEMIRFRLQVYAVDLLEDYVAVRFRRESLMGANLHEIEVAADVFDRHTGAKLTLGDLLDIAEHAQTLNQAVANHLRVADIRSVGDEPFDILAVENQAFTVTEHGIVLLFSPDELAYAPRGVIEVEVPWEVLN